MASQDILRQQFAESNAQLEAYQASQTQEAQEDTSLNDSADQISKALEQPVADNSSTTQVPQAQMQASHQENENWREVRENRKRLEQKVYELERALEARNAVKVEDDDPMPGISNDDIVTAKELKEALKRTKALEKKLEAAEVQHNEFVAETRLRVKHPDFFEVVTDDNLQELKKRAPEVANTIYEAKDPYAKHIAAYEYIKMYGIGNKVETFDENKLKVLNNAAKPKTIASITPKSSDKPLSEMNMYFTPLSSEEKARIRKQSNDIINGLI